MAGADSAILTPSLVAGEAAAAAIQARLGDHEPLPCVLWYPAPEQALGDRMQPDAHTAPIRPSVMVLCGLQPPILIDLYASGLGAAGTLHGDSNAQKRDLLGVFARAAAARRGPIGCVSGLASAQIMQSVAPEMPSPRWACARILSQLLIPNPSLVPATLGELCAQHHMPKIAEQVGLAQLVVQAHRLQQLLRVLAGKIKAADLASVARLEGALVGPLAAMQKAGLPFDRAIFRQCLQQDGTKSNLAAACGADGRVRGHFEQVGAATGRIICRSPNLQGVAQTLRPAFCAPAGRVLVVADYASFELCILAELSGDPLFLQVFADGVDLHAQVACALFDCPSPPPQEKRQAAKAIVYGLLYGMGVAGLAKRLDMGMAEAGELKDRFFQRFPKIYAFLEEGSRQGVARGEVRSVMGRRLILQEGSQAYRQAKNMPMQGSGADILKWAMVLLHRRLLREGGAKPAALVHTIHDELVVECEQDQAHSISKHVVEAMEEAGAMLLTRVSLRAEAVVQPSWSKPHKG